MEPDKCNQSPQATFQKNMELVNRRSEDRRTNECEGYTYISTVGWICRREKCRRKNDESAV